VTIPLTPSCRILVGINESGKSNILAALSLLDPEREFKADDLRDLRPNEDPDQDAEVVFVFAFTKEACNSP
jgi:recombinational DNA repair ATPase RecF